MLSLVIARDGSDADAPARRAHLVQPFGVLRRHLPPFGMHAVLLDVVGLDRQEGSGAHMQRQEARADTGGIEPGEKVFCEVKTGSRRGDGALAPATIAAPSGCSESRSALPARRSISSSLAPSTATTVGSRASSPTRTGCPCSARGPGPRAGPRTRPVRQSRGCADDSRIDPFSRDVKVKYLQTYIALKWLGLVVGGARMRHRAPMC